MRGASVPATFRLQGFDRARYFAPVLLFAFLAALCLALITVSPFLVTVQDALAIGVAGLFGMLATGAAGLLILRLQLRWLRYTAIPIATEPEAAFAAVRRLVTEAGWRITRQADDGLEARTPDALFAEGERISVRIHAHEVLVASICDPNVGFTLLGRERCQQHCDRVRRAVLAL